MDRPRRTSSGAAAATFLVFALALGALLAGCGGSGSACRGAGCLEVTNPSRDADAAGGGGDVTPDVPGAPVPDGTATDGVAASDVAEIVTGSVCTTGETNGCSGNRHIWGCAPDGESWIERPCFGSDGDGVCLGDQCTLCTPSNRKCEGDETVVQCDETGASYIPVDRCNGALTGRVCSQGVCTRLCELDIKFKDYMGCEYWAVDLDNAFVACGGRSGYCDAQGAPYAIVVSNPHPIWPAEVKIWSWDEAAGQAAQVAWDRDGLPIDNSPIRAGGLRIYFLSGNDVNGTMQGRLAYRIESSIPITAYQFNPLENVDVFSNDASLLLPTNALGRYYFVMTREQSFEMLRSYLTVIAVNPGETRVSVTVTGHTLVGDEDGIGHLEPGDSIVRRLQQYDVLNIETDRVGDDMTGSLILADRPVAVFGGSEASNAPNTNHCVDNPDYDPGLPDSLRKVCEAETTVACEETRDCSQYITCCADHLEQQMFPVKTWGMHYLATRSAARGDEKDNWRIIAAEDGTRVTTLPPQIAIPILNKGEWFDFETGQDFEIHANKPIMVGQFLQAEQAPAPGFQPGDAGTGDPAFLLNVAIEQFRTDYVFLAPNKYEFDYVNIVAPRDGPVAFDDERLGASEFQSFGTGAYKVARFLIEDGVHSVTASEPVSVIVYGYDQYVSYGYPAGLNLTELNEEPGMQ